MAEERLRQAKGQNLLRRGRFALAGIGHALRHERSFRTQCVAAVAATALTVALRPGWLWAALMMVLIALVLALELVNTAIEHLLDGLHPAQAPFVRVAKDCAAGAVLVLSVCSVLVFALMLAEVRG